MKYNLFALSCVGLLACSGCKDTANKQQKVLTQEVVFKKEGSLSVYKKGTKNTLASFDIEIADDEYQTQTGLMYRKSMLEDRAMLFIFKTEQPRSFYMKNTQFALDIIYINAQKEIVSIQKNAKPLDPTSLPSNTPTLYVLEVNGGVCDTLQISTGDSIEWFTTKK